LAALFAAVTVQAQTPAPAAKVLAPDEMRLQAEQIKKDIANDNRHVLHLQALAKKEKDVIKLTCINDKLVQIKAQMNLFDTATLQFDGSMGQGDDAPRAAFADITKAGDDVKKLRSEADGCAGELEMYKQESNTDVTRPELEDPTDGWPFQDPVEVGTPEIDQPGYATPWS
jgi:hypothetical protein